MSRESKRQADREERRTAHHEGSTAAQSTEPSERTAPAQFLREVRSELRKVA
jgi:hypothetical protein